MPFLDELRLRLEHEERITVGNAFGGTTSATKTSYSVTSIRDLVCGQSNFIGETSIERSLNRAKNTFITPIFKTIIANLIRASFLIELTNLTVGSTKMKTRWLPGLILMPQAGSFEPIRGSFEPGNDPRAATFEECSKIFATILEEVCNQSQSDSSIGNFIKELNDSRRVPYEFPFTYCDPRAEPVHTSENVEWAVPGHLTWLLKARLILDKATPEHLRVLNEIKKAKIQVKVYKTDRALTGKDKTNRAKRWEVLAGDFQHATLPQCWSVEKKITTDLVLFEGFPEEIKAKFVNQNLIVGDEPTTRCPVTMEPLRFDQLSAAILNHTHGVSDYQIGHLHPLKRGGVHDGHNVCWQSADGNRLQGPLSIEETNQLLDAIAARRQSLRQSFQA